MRRRTSWLLMMLGYVALAGGLWLLVERCGGVACLGDWLAAGGAGTVACFILLFAAWNLVLPPMPLQLLAGFAYGFVGGVAVIYAGSSLAIVISCVLARSIWRAPIAAWVSRRPVWRALDQAITESGWRAVLLLRLSNVLPSNLANYACGCTAQPLTTILWASWLGKLPGVVMSVLLGLAGRQVSTFTLADNQALLLSLVVGIIATALLSVLLVRRTRARLLPARVRDGGLPPALETPA